MSKINIPKVKLSARTIIRDGVVEISKELAKDPNLNQRYGFWMKMAGMDPVQYVSEQATRSIAAASEERVDTLINRIHLMDQRLKDNGY